MRLALHTVLCCCVFTTVLPLEKGATGELSPSLRKRFKVRLQSRMKRELCSQMTANEQHSDIHAGSKQEGNEKVFSPPSSFGLNIRARRSTSTKSSSCKLVTCTLPDLLYKLHQMSNSENSQKEEKAPEHKIGSKGYGRRRRSLLDITLLALQTEGRSTEAASKCELGN